MTELTDFITIEFPTGYEVEIEVVFHKGRFCDENGWLDMYLN